MSNNNFPATPWNALQAKRRPRAKSAKADRDATQARAEVVGTGGNERVFDKRYTNESSARKTSRRFAAAGRGKPETPANIPKKDSAADSEIPAQVQEEKFEPVEIKEQPPRELSKPSRPRDQHRKKSAAHPSGKTH